MGINIHQHSLAYILLNLNLLYIILKMYCCISYTTPTDTIKLVETIANDKWVAHTEKVLIKAFTKGLIGFGFSATPTWVPRRSSWRRYRPSCSSSAPWCPGPPWTCTPPPGRSPWCPGCRWGPAPPRRCGSGGPRTDTRRTLPCRTSCTRRRASLRDDGNYPTLKKRGIDRVISSSLPVKM